MLRAVGSEFLPRFGCALQTGTRLGLLHFVSVFVWKVLKPEYSRLSHVGLCCLGLLVKALFQLGWQFVRHSGISA